MVDQSLIRTKIAHIHKNLERLTKKNGISLEAFKLDSDAQDIVIHNLQLAIQGAIDIASHIVSDERWGVPNTLMGLYDILREHKVIDAGMADTMKRMVGFRNIIVHEYEDIDLEKVHQTLTSRLVDFKAYLRRIAEFAKL